MHDLIGDVSLFHATTTTVGDLHQGLFQQEAVGGIHDVGAAAEEFGAEGIDIEGGIIATQGEAEAPFAGGGTVTGSHVATGLGEGREHILFEDDAGGFFHSLNNGFGDGDEAVDVDDDVRLAIRRGMDDAIGDRGDVGGAGEELNGTGEVTDFTTGVETGDEELLLGARTVEDNLCRFDDDPFWRSDVLRGVRSSRSGLGSFLSGEGGQRECNREESDPRRGNPP